MDKIKRNKILKYSLTAATLGSIVAAVTFGVVSYTGNPEIFKKSHEYQNKYESQVKVDWGSEKKDINHVASYLYDRLDFYGYENGEIKIINDDTLSIIMPVSTFDNKKDDEWSILTEEELTREVLAFQNAVTQKQNIEFRHFDGTQLFDLVEGQIKFIEPKPPEEPDGGYSSTLSAPDDLYDKYELQLFKDAKVSYNNGVPYIEVLPVNENVLEEFRKMGRTLPLLRTGESQQGNTAIAWFGYDELAWRAKATDYDQFEKANFDPLTYAFTDTLGETSELIRLEAEANYVTTWPIESEFSIHEDWIPIYGSFTQQYALSAVSSIKFANQKFDLDITSTNLIINQETLAANSWLIWVYLSIIVLVAFFMMYWNGLLGLIATSGIGVLVFSLIGFILIMGIPVTTGLLTVISFVILMSFFANLFILKIVKTPQEESKTIWEKAKTYIRNISVSTTIVMVIAMVFLSSVIFFLPVSIGMTLFIALIGIAMFLLINYFFVLPLIVGMGYMFNFTPNKDSKWNLINGVTKDLNLDLNVSNQLVKIASPFLLKNIATVATTVTFIGLTVFGIMSIVGTGANVKYPSNDYYKYDVVLTQRWDEDEILEIPPGMENDPYNQKQMIKNVQTDTSDISKVFRDNKVSVISTTIIRNDDFFLWKLLDPDGIHEEIYNYDFSYGLSIYSETKMNGEALLSIEKKLLSTGDGYTLAEQSSLTDLDNVSKYELYTQSRDNSLMAWGLVGAMFITLLFIIAYFKWSGVIAVSSSIIIESLLAFALTIIFWTPWTAMFWIGLLLIIGFSLITKAMSTAYVRQRIIKTKRNSEEDVYIFFKNYASKALLPTSLIVVMSILFLTLSIIIQPSLIGMVSIMIFGLIIAVINNTLAYPKLSSTLYGFRQRIKERKLMQDEQYSLDPNTIDEEYIKGVNK